VFFKDGYRSHKHSNCTQAVNNNVDNLFVNVFLLLGDSYFIDSLIDQLHDVELIEGDFGFREIVLNTPNKCRGHVAVDILGFVLP